MSVHNPQADRLSIDRGYDPTADTCTLCSEVLDQSAPCVVWSLSNAELNLHPQCSIELGAHLGKDGINARNLAANLARSAIH